MWARMYVYVCMYVFVHMYMCGYLPASRVRANVSHVRSVESGAGKSGVVVVVVSLFLLIRNSCTNSAARYSVKCSNKQRQL